jgi:hypothetical protein
MKRNMQEKAFLRLASSNGRKALLTNHCMAHCAAEGGNQTRAEG